MAHLAESEINYILGLCVTQAIYVSRMSVETESTASSYTRLECLVSLLTVLEILSSSEHLPAYQLQCVSIYSSPARSMVHAFQVLLTP